MNITEYQDAASRTCPNLGSIEKNFLHMKLGVITEIAETLDIIKKNMAYGKELDVVHIGEEIADTCWYIVNDARMRHIHLTTDGIIREYLGIGPILSVEDVIGTLGDILMFHLGAFASEMDDPHLRLVLLRQVAEFYDLDFYQILENNINKLRVRFPEKFEGTLAINRDIKAERVELEK